MAPDHDNGKHTSDEELQSQKRSSKFGHFLAHPPPGEDLVISGLAGCYPNSDTVTDFQENLFNKADLVSDDERRWAPFHPEIPQRTGKINDIEELDAGFFGNHFRQANSMDPMVRLFLQRAIEAIYDAGINPKDLENTNTGVFVGACFSESERKLMTDLQSQAYGLIGCTRSMIPNRLSYYLKLKGPSYITDTACSSSLYALEHAYKSIRMGQCDQAIIGGTNICLHPFVSLQFHRLGVLSKDGSCKVFDEAGNGYARSETISAIFLQKAKDAKRIYAHVIHAKTNCDGFKGEGITYPSGEMQTKLLKEFYQECKVDPRILSYLEAHGTGTKVGDPEEVSSIDSVFCTGRDTPLLIGSVKSNIGHTEPASGLCSLTKCIIAFETGYIPPNLHYSTPRVGVKALEEGRLEVVTNKMQFKDDRGIIGVNSFGFGGGNCHILLRWNQKVKEHKLCDDLPRLTCVSGRVEKTVQLLLDDIKKTAVDVEFIKLLQSLFRENHNYHFYRGYSIVSKSGELSRSVRYYNNETPKLHFVFGDLSYGWQAIGRNLFTLPIFAASLQRVQKLISLRGVNIIDLIFGEKTDDITISIIGNVAVQIGIIDLIRKLEIIPDTICGIGLGEILCAYYDQVFTLEEVLEFSYAIALAANSIKYQSELYLIKTPVESGILQKFNVISIISENVFIISDEENKLMEFSRNNIHVVIEKLNLSLVNFYSKEFFELSSQIGKNMAKIINKPKKWSKKHLTSFGQIVTAENCVNSLTNLTSIQNSIKIFNKEDVVVEVGIGQILPLLQEASQIELNALSLFDTEKDLSLVTFLESLGSIYELGFTPKVEYLYPKIDFPVSRGTPMISTNYKWNHEHHWKVRYYANDEGDKGLAEKNYNIIVKYPEFNYITGHVIDGRNIFPATGYLTLVWETFSQVSCVVMSDMKIVFENCRFHRATNVPQNSKLVLSVMIQRETGNFEVIEGNSVVVTGKIYALEENANQLPHGCLPIDTNPEEPKLKTKDIYKELRLRGYNYKGSFRNLVECNVSGTKGLIKWDGNYVSFVDNMLQLRILNVDTRLLYVPTGINKLIINGPLHAAITKSIENSEIPVEVYSDSGIITSGGIEIYGLKSNSIARRRTQANPVLENYTFVPNIANLDLLHSVKVNMQLILENIMTIKVKVVELIDEAVETGYESLSPVILDVLADLPLIQPDITILSKQHLDISNVTVEDSKLTSKTDCILIVAKNLLSRKLVLNQCFDALKLNGYLLSRESQDFELKSINQEDLNINIITIHKTNSETLVLLSKSRPRKQYNIVVKPNNEEFSWLQNLQNGIKNNETVVLYVQNDSTNGVLGLLNCIKRESGGQNLKGVFIMDENCPFNDNNDKEVLNQLKKNLNVNVYKNGQWGTYRHLPLHNIQQIETEHCYVNNAVKGDLSSLKWLEGRLTNETILDAGKCRVKVYYSALNFRDIMTATGRINTDVVSASRLEQMCVQGFEYAGRDENGNKVIGMVKHSALATELEACSYFQWKVPEYWTMAEAATTPVVYATCVYALVKRAKMKRGNTVLIHSGTGGIGQAGIQLALHYGCTVYTTVGNTEKREFLKKRFPQLTDKNIFNSRNLSFEQDVMKATSGCGVDIVLNSLAEDKQIASARCLAHGGHFLEIGKFDLINNTTLNLTLLQKEASFHGIMLDEIVSNNEKLKTLIHGLIEKGIKEGAIKPLNTTVFGIDEIEKAYRYMASGIHTGKILIEIRKEEEQKIYTPPKQLFKCSPRYYCNPQATYIIIGGLGGFGLELADWLILRGARNLLLTSRNGIKNGYQELRLNFWKTYGVKVIISRVDVTTLKGCEQLIQDAEKIAPVHAIFNLAVVLQDSILENQSIESFQKSFGPKAVATKNLDIVTRRLCPNLRDFVVFSSVSCGRGNAGQSNYGMSNSVMERICEQRFKDGLPAVAIQWGAIGEVGLVAEMQEEAIEIEIGGTLQQSVSSCLEVLDVFLKQRETPIVASMVVAQKRTGIGSADNIVDAVGSILGVHDLKEISLHSTLAELGMDSMTAVEIKQTLEREFEVFLTPSDIRSMTFARLLEIQEQMESNDQNPSVKAGKGGADIPTLNMLLTVIGDESTINEPEVELESNGQENSQKVLLIPGIEAVAPTLLPLTTNLNVNAVGFQVGSLQNESIADMAKNLYSNVLKHVSKTTPFVMVAHSFGVLVGLELMALLESNNYKGHLVCIDGSPVFLKRLLSILDMGSEALLQTSLVVHLLQMILKESVEQYKEDIFKCKTFEERIKLGQTIAEHNLSESKFKSQNIFHSVKAVYNRLLCVKNYSPSFVKLKSKITLLKPKYSNLDGMENDFKLSELTEQDVDVLEFEGNHYTMLGNKELAGYINAIVGIE